jgi:hypothetical protein
MNWNIIFALFVFLRQTVSGEPLPNWTFQIHNAVEISGRMKLAVSLKNNTPAPITIARKELEGVRLSLDVWEKASGKISPSYGATPLPIDDQSSIVLDRNRSIMLLISLPPAVVFSEPSYKGTIEFRHPRLSIEKKFLYERNAGGELMLSLLGRVDK